MATNFQSSFIPKNENENSSYRKEASNFLETVFKTIFILSIVGAALLAGYKYILKGDIASLRTQLAEAEKGIDKSTIKEMLKFSQKLDIAESVVMKHRVISNFLYALSSSTVASVSFSNFQFGSLNGDGLSVVMQGRASGYAVVALQEDLFSKNKYWKDIRFSELALTQGSQVSFKVSIMLDPHMLDYTPPISQQSTTQTNSSDSELNAGMKELENINLGEIDNI